MSVAIAQSKSPLRARVALRRIGIVGAATTATVLLFAGPALAHITVTPNSVVAGSTDVLTFHVPNEEAKADTVKVDVQIPTDHPIAQLLVEQVPGWTATVKNITLAKPIVTDDGKFTQAVSEVIWSGGKIAPGQFQDFSISADPMPTGESQVTFKAIQTYSNGDVVRWIDLKQPGQPDPDHPAPTVALTTGTTTATTSAKSTTATASAGSSSDGLARVLAIAGLLIALLSGLLALTVVRQARRLAGGVAAAASDDPSPTPAAKTEPTKAQPTKTGSKNTAQREPVSAGSKSAARRGQPQSRRRG
ncbi:MAG TPA: YcnI family protein [Streptosporangiaceae bacterium]|nr:YcnI family protein [Streptosporangiaceae bacterium]